MRIEVQVAVPKPARRVAARAEIPAEKLGEVAKGLRESPLREQLEKMARGGKRGR